MSDVKTIEFTDQEEKEAPKKQSKIAGLIVPIILLLIAGGAGFGFSKALIVPAAEEAGALMADAPAKKEMAKKDGGKAEKDGKSEEGEAITDGSGVHLVEMDPIVTNLADPSDVWLRAEFSLMIKGEVAEGMVEGIQQDFLAYLRTVKLYNLEGGSGFQHLMEDLNERAAFNSENQVSEVLVRAFLVE